MEPLAIATITHPILINNKQAPTLSSKTPAEALKEQGRTGVDTTEEWMKKGDIQSVEEEVWEGLRK